MKKIITLCLCAALLPNAHAASTHHRHHPHHLSGWFMGVHTGAEVGLFNHHSLSRADLNGNNTTEFANHDIESRVSPHTGIALGFAKAWRRLYLAVSTSINFSREVYRGQSQMNQFGTPNFNLENTVMVTSDSLDYGVQIMPGYMVKPDIAVYGLLGLSRSRFILNSDTYYNYQSNTNLDAGILKASRKQTKVGTMLGAGIRAEVMPRLQVSCQYIYKRYGLLNVSGTQPIIGAQLGDALATTTHVRPNSQIFQLGIDIILKNSE